MVASRRCRRPAGNADHNATRRYARSRVMSSENAETAIVLSGFGARRRGQVDLNVLAHADDQLRPVADDRVTAGCGVPDGCRCDVDAVEVVDRRGGGRHQLMRADLPQRGAQRGRPRDAVDRQAGRLHGAHARVERLERVWRPRQAAARLRQRRRRGRSRVRRRTARPGRDRRRSRSIPHAERCRQTGTPASSMNESGIASVTALLRDQLLRRPVDLADRLTAAEGGRDELRDRRGLTDGTAAAPAHRHDVPSCMTTD